MMIRNYKRAKDVVLRNIMLSYYEMRDVSLITKEGSEFTPIE